MELEQFLESLSLQLGDVDNRVPLTAAMLSLEGHQRLMTPSARCTSSG
jgi:hypothetical protein